jgi:hypothetical protein
MKMKRKEMVTFKAHGAGSRKRRGTRMIAEIRESAMF